jgi:hypothetical protein
MGRLSSLLRRLFSLITEATRLKNPSKEVRLRCRTVCNRNGLAGKTIGVLLGNIFGTVFSQTGKLSHVHSKAKPPL